MLEIRDLHAEINGKEILKGVNLTINKGETLFEHRFVDYDREKASNKLRKQNFDGAEKLGEMLLNPTVRHF